MSKLPLRIFLFSAAAFAVLLFHTSCTQGIVSSAVAELPCSEIREDISGKPEILILKNEISSLRLKNGSSIIYCGKIPVFMPDKVMRDSKKSRWELPERSVKSVLYPLLTKQKLKGKIILIDPGHGGKDFGAPSPFSPKKSEKDVNLTLALFLGSELEKHGFTVRYTRRNDQYIKLNQRGNAIPADIFISVHHNSSTNCNAAGFEVFCLKSDVPGRIEQIIQSTRLAFAVQKAQSELPGAMVRGVKYANFQVLRDARCPAILIEAGFLSNKKDAARCLDVNNQKILAAALARAIRETVSP